MCLIVYQPPGSEAITGEVLANGWRQNDDGAGYMFVADGKLVIRKPFYKLAKLKKAYAEDFAKHGKDSPFVVHFRWATHGGHNKENIHPHPIPMYDHTECGLVHNGILDVAPPAGMSDTAYFVQTTLAYRESDQLHDENFIAWLGDVIGLGNKFVIMSNDGRVSIVNEEMGEWDGSYWYSNNGYKTSALVKWRPMAKYQDIVHPTDALFGHMDEWDTMDEDNWKVRVSQEEFARMEEMDAKILKDVG